MPAGIVELPFRPDGPIPQREPEIRWPVSAANTNEFLPVRSYICVWRTIFAPVARHSKKMVAVKERGPAGPARFETLAKPGPGGLQTLLSR
ncbi:hypothetical protein J2766_001247 [Agrobacterium tumefaciens]|uniref:Uncharacterized protein n=1 Tax=Agrobacterium tumefaciens TaxID=358 RepID=A0AAW8LN06_AGRTU|nr:hypothetical protein [Agrobacterium tumefaciens]MDR6701447.1 hypothetical protein [Agrobacterium tumefaciens]TCV55113.1 hypothetical protein EDB97_101203 [Agrobacterium tumefaciens]